MAAKLVCVFVALVFALNRVECRSVWEDENDDTLELVHVIFRHGDRTPDKSVIYKNDPYINVTYYPIGFGQLTNAGKRKEYGIGKALRKRYYDFIASNFTLDSVEARSTDYNRTKMSMQLVLASLFPPRGEYVWENRLNWQPVPFNYWPVQDDHVLGDPLKNCPMYQKKLFEYLNSTKGQGPYENFTEIIRFLEEKTGQALHSKSFAELYFTLTTESENGYEMPEWAKKTYDNITQLAIMDYIASTATPELKRLSTGFLMKKIMDDTRSKIKGVQYENTKIFLYSAHELNVAFVLRFLGIFHDHVPPYGSYVAIEIHNYNGVRGIKLFYQEYTSEKPKRYKIPNCGNFCRLERFLSLYGDLFPYSEKECF